MTRKAFKWAALLADMLTTAGRMYRWRKRVQRVRAEAERELTTVGIVDAQAVTFYLDADWSTAQLREIGDKVVVAGRTVPSGPRHHAGPRTMRRRALDAAHAPAAVVGWLRRPTSLRPDERATAAGAAALTGSGVGALLCGVLAIVTVLS